MRALKDTQKQKAMYKSLFGLMLVFVVILIAGNAAMTFAIVQLSKETEYDGGMMKTKSGDEVGTGSSVRVDEA